LEFFAAAEILPARGGDAAVGAVLRFPAGHSSFRICWLAIQQLAEYVILADGGA